MTADPFEGRTPLFSEGFAARERHLERFEQAWFRGERPRIEDFLGDGDDSDLVLALMQIDLEFRAKAGERVRAEPYLERFSALAASEAHVCQLLATEFRLRRRDEPDLAISDYHARFPEVFTTLGDDDARRLFHDDNRTPPRRGLQIRCPYCRNPIDLLDDSELSDVTCPSCGSGFSMVPEETAVAPDQADRIIAHFRLQERVGIGAFGAVWKARDTELDRTVAIKIPRKGELNAAETEQFLREARSAAQLAHANIVSVHEIGKEEDQLYIVSDFVDGLTLASWLTGQRPTFREAVELCIPIADALHHAHESGVIHRDLKPANILLDARGVPHLTDFGLAKREAGEITITHDGKTLGTPAYMSPEQARGDSHQADRRSDVYSLGVILFELLTGELPFRGDVRMLLHQTLHEEVESPRKLRAGLPRDLETICLKCLRKERGRRYQTAAEVASDLRRWADGKPIDARPVGRLERTWLWCKRRPVVSGAVSAVLITTVTFSIVGYATYGRLQGRAAVEALLSADPYAVGQAAKRAADHRRWSETPLRELLANTERQVADPPEGESRQRAEDTFRRRLHARLALVRFDPRERAPLLDEALFGLSSRDLTYLGPIRESLGEDREASDRCWALLHDTSKPAPVRFRAGLILAGLCPDSETWTESDRRYLVEEFARRSAFNQPEILKLLEPIGSALLPAFELVFADTQRSKEERLAATHAIAAFAGDDAHRLARLLAQATIPQYHVLREHWDRVATAEVQSEFEAALQSIAAREPTPDASAVSCVALGRERAGAAAILSERAHRDAVFSVLRFDEDPEALTQFVHGCRARGVRFADLVEWFEELTARRGRIRQDAEAGEADDTVLYGLLLALGEYEPDGLSPGRRESLVSRLVSTYASDPDAGVHAASGWLLRRWGHADEAQRVDRTPVPYDTSGRREWFVMEFKTTRRERHPIGTMVEIFDSLTSDRDRPENRHTQKHFMTFVVFRPGTHRLGSAESESNRSEDETLRTVTLTRPLAVCNQEVTWSLWMAMDGPKDRNYLAEKEFKTGLDAEHPVSGVSWLDAVDYCRWLTSQAGMSEREQFYLDPASLPKDSNGNPVDWTVRPEAGGFRLLSESEWESVCRHGTRTAYSFGNDETLLQHYGWLQDSGTASAAHTGQLRPSVAGLFDMHGNVSEWCHDRYAQYVSGGTDLFGPARGGGLLPESGVSTRDWILKRELDERTNRGGSYAHNAGGARSAYRMSDAPNWYYQHVGFRICFHPEQALAIGRDVTDNDGD